jgi:hypothetical protein
MLSKQEAALETTSPERLKELARQSVKLARIVAKNPVAPAELLKKLATSTDKKIKKAVAANPNTPVEELMTLGAEFPKQLLENPIFDLLLLENPNFLEQIPPKTLIGLLSLPEIPKDFVMLARKCLSKLHCWERIGLAKNPNTQIELLEILAQDQNKYVRSDVAENPNTPIKLLEILAQDQEYNIRRSVAKNPNTPIKLLEIFAQVETFAKNQDNKIRFGVINNPNTPIKLLKILAQDRDEEVRRLATQNLITLTT